MRLTVNRKMDKMIQLLVGKNEGKLTISRTNK